VSTFQHLLSIMTDNYFYTHDIFKDLRRRGRTLLEGARKMPYICNNKNQHFVNNSNRQDYGKKTNLPMNNLQDQQYED
jgi:hypothetical protein